MVGGNITCGLVFLAKIKFRMPQSVGVTGVLVNFCRVLVVRQLIFVDSRASKILSSVGVIEVSVLHEVETIMTKSRVGFPALVYKLALLLGGGSIERSVHLGVVGLKRIDVGHEGILHVRV